jgi:hypothetical protein
MALGMLERFLYAGILMIGIWQLIAGWFPLKVSAKWKTPSTYREADNVWMPAHTLTVM